MKRSHDTEIEIRTIGDWCGFLYMKYYRAPRYRMRCMTIVLVEQRCSGFKINDLHFWENNVLTKTERNYNMRNICVRDAPCWDPNVLNASSTNCNCERVFAQSAKLQLRLPVRGSKRRMRIQNAALKIHVPVPKCLSSKKQKKVFNKYQIAYCCNQYLRENVRLFLFCVIRTDDLNRRFAPKLLCHQTAALTFLCDVVVLQKISSKACFVQLQESGHRVCDSLHKNAAIFSWNYNETRTNSRQRDVLVTYRVYKYEMRISDNRWCSGANCVTKISYRTISLCHQRVLDALVW